MVYTSSHKNTDGLLCTDTIEADLVGRASEECAPSGLWKSEVTATGKPGHVELRIDGGRCAIQSPDFKGEGACEVKGNELTFQPDQSSTSSTTSWAGACGNNEGRYTFSIAQGCSGLVLESTQDACDGRVHAVDYLFLRRVK